VHYTTAFAKRPLTSVGDLGDERADLRADQRLVESPR
jgi:hypothetical protein